MIAAVLGREKLEVPCTVEIEHTHDSLHAHVELEGVEVGPGDSVIVHDAPTEVPFGARLRVRRRATVVRGNRFDRLWTRLQARFELTELYEVSFTDRRQL